jgi:hypothetical protein
MNKTYLFFPVFLLLLCGCQSSFGPRAIKYTHPAYNQVVNNTQNQQLLLNLVRLKYRDTPFFLNINSITASFSMGATLGVEAELPWDFDETGTRTGDGRLVRPDVGMSYSQSPTISYAPLQGEDFVDSILTPISFLTILKVAKSGWRTDRVFGLFLERVNNLYNAPSASGPTPVEEPKFKEFKRMLELFHELRQARLIEAGFELDANNRRQVKLLIKTDSNYQSEIAEIKSLFGVSQQLNSYSINTDFLYVTDDVLDMSIRSIQSVLHYLSHNVEVPEKHKEAGLVTITKNRDGKEFDWNDTPAGSVFKVKSTNWGKPDNAYVSVPYRGNWFYISDDDLSSKSTFMLLKQVFSLQAGKIIDAGPTLTLPVGGG